MVERFFLDRISSDRNGFAKIIGSEYAVGIKAGAANTSPIRFQAAFERTQPAMNAAVIQPGII